MPVRAESPLIKLRFELENLVSPRDGRWKKAGIGNDVTKAADAAPQRDISAAASRMITAGVVTCAYDICRWTHNFLSSFIAYFIFLHFA